MNFIKSAFDTSDFISDNIPEVCFIGRSNVGKSSLINVLAKKKIAKTSSTPGRTQLVNFFDFKAFRIVDLPGYGFSKLSKEKRGNILYVVENYLHNAPNLKVIVQICDYGIITGLDIEMSLYFKKLKKKHIIVLNKIDKYKMSPLKRIDEIAKMLQIKKEFMITVSASKQINIKKLNQLIYENIIG